MKEVAVGKKYNNYIITTILLLEMPKSIKKSMKTPANTYWLVVYLPPRKNDGVRQIGSSSPVLGKKKLCSKSPASIIYPLVN